MSERPDIALALAEGEVLLWQGHPKPGRPTPGRAWLIATACFALSVAGLLLAGWVELFRGHLPVWHLAVYGLLATAAFFTYLGLRLTLLNTRRARARDARTTYGITDRRALTLAGPYKADLPLTAGLRAEADAAALTITSQTARLCFERLDDAPAARDILMGQIKGAA